eukprot:100511-Amorphochlora_amoeboformis.AAC.1
MGRISAVVVLGVSLMAFYWGHSHFGTKDQISMSTQMRRTGFGGISRRPGRLGRSLKHIQPRGSIRVCSNEISYFLGERAREGGEREGRGGRERGERVERYPSCTPFPLPSLYTHS